MLIDSLTYTIERTGCIDAFWGKLDAKEDATLGIAASARPFMVAARFAHAPQPTLVVVAGDETAHSFARSVAAYLGDSKVFYYPERSDHAFSHKPSDPTQIACRLKAAHALQNGTCAVVVASASALIRKLPPPTAHVADPLVFEIDHSTSDEQHTTITTLTSFEEVPYALEERGYLHTDKLDGPGTFCITGGVIDIYPGNLPYPVRLDFFGDDLDEIRRIVPSTGQTIATLKHVEIYAVRELSCSKKAQVKLAHTLERPARTNPGLRSLREQLEVNLHFDGADALLPYLYDETTTLGAYATKDVLTVQIEPRSLIDEATRQYDDIQTKAKGSKISLDGLYASAAELDFGHGQRATYLSLMRAGGTLDAELPVKRTEVAGHPDKLYGRLHALVDASYTVVFSAPNFRARQDLKLAFVENNLSIDEILEADVLDKNTSNSAPIRKLKRGVVNVVDVEIPLGMIIPKAKLALISINDTQGSSFTRPSKHVDITAITFPYQPGDYVVHAAHGVANFSGLVRQEIDGQQRDYLLLDYAENDKLYVPVEQLDRVTRYVGSESSAPRLTRLNTSDWSRALARAHKATKKLAFDLVDIYTRRAAVKGFAFSPDTPWQKEMENAFPYQETPDQLQAIADVKADMQSSKPMDRLICGDVGFGKTEVALRAAFKATQDNKQVMVLCPTTILAQQHYTTFNERCEPFGVRVEVLSRFRTPAQQTALLADFAVGTIDILVGTHRLLSRDVNPHDLGLVIIDEEQRFGVGHKEQLKNLREYIDVLALSATPIPRTLQMSLSGVRDMSLILTPPQKRRAVEVHVGEWDPDLVSAAIRRELARNGQVYYVSNRVHTIDDAVARVKDAAAEARIGVAHGQMDKTELENVMEEFSAGECDVLVSTTIIESGIDNPHTNTLIIEDAQRLGLAQMYQLKGRVGRSTTQAYAYFMFPDTIPLTEEATARLMALNEHQDLGSGMRIALRDLEIRGAGSLLGAEQSGNMSAVGFDLFAQMLANAVTAAREGVPNTTDELPPALSDITVNVPVDTYLPEEFIPDTDERVLWYRKLASASTIAAVDEIEADLKTKQTPLPAEAANLLAKTRIRAYASEHHLRLISVMGNKLVVEPIDISREDQISLRRSGGRYLADKRKLRLPLKYFKGEGDDNLLDAIFSFLQRLT